jgi:hypothetical protein
MARVATGQNQLICRQPLPESMKHSRRVSNQKMLRGSSRSEARSTILPTGINQFGRHLQYCLLRWALPMSAGGHCLECAM